jgi:hypothetical protein
MQSFTYCDIVGHLKNVNPTLAQVPNRITNIEFTTVSSTIANMLLAAGILFLLIFSIFQD